MMTAVTSLAVVTFNNMPGEIFNFFLFWVSKLEATFFIRSLSSKLTLLCWVPKYTVSREALEANEFLVSI